MDTDDTGQAGTPTFEIGLPCDDIAAMRRFYCSCLGFEPFGTVDLPTAHIEGYRLGAHLVKATVFTNEAQRATPRLPSLKSPYVSVRVSDIHAVVARGQALGYRPLVPVSAAVTAEGRRVALAFFADPMGNRIELVEGDPWCRFSPVPAACG